jgi:hypothetical protein
MPEASDLRRRDLRVKAGPGGRGAAEAIHAEVGARSPDLDGLVGEVEAALRDALGEGFDAAVDAGRALAPDAAVATSRAAVVNK